MPRRRLSGSCIVARQANHLHGPGGFDTAAARHHSLIHLSGAGVTKAEPTRHRGPAGRRGDPLVTLATISMVLGLCGLVFLAVGTVLSAWNERRTLLSEAQAHAEDSAFFLADHAQRLFAVADIALRSSTLETQGIDWATLERSSSAWTTLRDFNALLPSVEDLWLNDETGRLRLTTFAFPTPVSNAADRPIFAAVKERDAMLVGDRIVGKVTRRPTFLVGRRLQTADGTFRGMISATLDLSYFTNYWGRLKLPNRERIAVVRAEAGDVLIASDEGQSSTDPERPVQPLLAAVAENPDAGSFAPALDRYGYYHRVGDLPLYLTVEFDRAGVLRAWRAWIYRSAPLVLAAVLALLSLMVFGWRQGRREGQAAREIADARAALLTANQHLEERVAARTADLQESNQEIQRYAYVVSHDLRAPLVNITGFTVELEDLRAVLFGPSDDVAAKAAAQRDFDEAIGFIRSSAAKMDRLINAILTLSREGRRRFSPEPIELTALLGSVADGVAHRAQTAGAIVTIEALPTLRSDRIGVEQIFSNLVDNAVKYLRPQVPGRIVVSGERLDGRVVVRVVDNGRGIDIKDAERVFELFRRAGAQDQPGEGIGLAHVRALVRRLGGQISLAGNPDGGSVFSVELPDLDEATWMDLPA